MKAAIAWMLLASLLVPACSRKAKPANPPPTKPADPPTKPADPPTVLSPLSPEEVARLDKQRAVIQEVATRRYRAEAFTRTRADLPVLQRLLDDRVFAKTQTYELQCLGVVFGDVLATELPLWWMRATEGAESWPTLRYKDTTVQINALTIISKRVEDGDPVDLAELIAGTAEAVQNLERKLGP